jgi:hypothetical protein
MNWTPEQWALWEERAAIMKFDAGLPRAEAEEKAMDDRLRLEMWDGQDGWLLDVPYDDGTTPRQRKAIVVNK